MQPSFWPSACSLKLKPKPELNVVLQITDLRRNTFKKGLKRQEAFRLLQYSVTLLRIKMDRFFLHNEVAVLFIATIKNLLKNRVPRLGAALAFYMALSLAPTVVIMLYIAGSMFGSKAAESRLVLEIQNLIGQSGAKIIGTIVEGGYRPSRGAIATIIGLVTLFFGATAVVSEMQDALNTIWRVEDLRASSTGGQMLIWLKDRVFAFCLVLGAGMLLLGSLTLSVWVSLAQQFLVTPPHALAKIADTLFSLIVVATLLTFLFKVLPNVLLRWTDVLPGAILTTLLLMAGKALLGAYLANAHYEDIYGAAGSLVILLVWIYYTAQVIYFGAEFTREYTIRHGSHTLLEQSKESGNALSEVNHAEIS